MTFAKNNLLAVDYYREPGSVSEIIGDSIILNEGDRIYVSVKTSRNVISSAYRFSGFRLYEEDETDGKYYMTDTVIPADDGSILEWSQDRAGQELSIVPVGSYLPRKISLKSTYLDSDGIEHELYGDRWEVNKDKVKGDMTEVSAISSYDVVFRYDPDEYFLVETVPGSYSSEDGTVTFDRRDPKEETQDYSVKLSEYLTVTIKTQEERKAFINDGVEEKFNSNKPLSISGLKYGDMIIIRTDSEWETLKNSDQLICKTDRKVNGKWEYTMEVPKPGNLFAFDPEEYSYAHGTIEFCYNGEKIAETRYIEEGRIITYEAVSCEQGYRLPDGDHKIVISTPEETIEKLKAICFVESTVVKVKLPQPRYGGRIDYYLNNKMINDDQIECWCGDRIEMKCSHWDGWSGHGQATYTVEEKETQTVLYKDEPVDTLFKETEGHKPDLYVSIDASVGLDTKFSVSASGLNKSDLCYRHETAWENVKNIFHIFTNIKNFNMSGDLIIQQEKIGTEKDITISADTLVGHNGKAIKVQVYKKVRDKSGEDEISTYFLNESSNQINIPIYVGSRQNESTVVYDGIIIRVSLTEVEQYRTPVAVENGFVAVYSCDQPRVEILDGDLVDKTDDVIVELHPDIGYYVTGKSVKDEIYSEKIKFSDYLADIRKMVEKHPIKKYIRITLDGADGYGTCEYKYNGQVVSGFVNVKPGDEITLQYTISEPDYRIVSGSGAFKFIKDIFTNDKTITRTIAVDETYDGITLNRESFDIELEKEA